MIIQLLALSVLFILFAWKEIGQEYEVRKYMLKVFNFYF